MYFYLSTSNNPYYNLALEEYLLKSVDEDILLCYVNAPSVVIGRFQVPYREINAAFAHENDIKIARRLSGGGTVFHDMGNLNYSFITNCVEQEEGYYDFFNKKTITVLKDLGLGDLAFQRNNIFCNDKKISGVAQYKRGKRMVHHGTLLVDANLEQLRALFTSKDYYQTKGVASVSSSVSNINAFVDTSMVDVIKAFEDSCIDKLKPLSFDDEVVEMAAYYSRKEWVYGKSPKYSIEKLEVNLEIEKGKIISVNDPQYLHLVGHNHCFEEILDTVNNADLFF